jgi:nucleoside-diphosphate-sugar epimerase
MCNKVTITGASGFVGKNLTPYLENNKFLVEPVKVITGFELSSCSSEIVIHLAGKAHDIKQVDHPEEYYAVNTELTKRVFDSFLASEAKMFILLSSVKAVADSITGVLTEDIEPDPKTHYGKSKLLAENYIRSKQVPSDKRVYILRPCMIHGPGNKGNLNLLFEVVSRKLPWLLAGFRNQRSFLTVENLCFVVRELIIRKDIESGIYNVADDGSVSTNELISLIGETINKKVVLLNWPPPLIRSMAIIGDFLSLPLNSERLKKLTENYVVSNKKIVSALGRELPVNTKEGLKNTIRSFQEK